jgi:hypothetical protein
MTQTDILLKFLLINLEKRNLTLIKVKNPIINDNILAEWIMYILVDPKNKNGANIHEKSGLQYPLIAFEKLGITYS